MNNPKNHENQSNNELAVQVYLHEHSKLRDEIMHHINVKLQIPVWAFGAASIAIPLLLSQSATIPLSMIASLLYAITIIFAGMTMNYTAALHGIHRITSYMRDFIEPQVNQIIKTDGHVGFQWETFIKQRRTSALTLFLEISGEIGTVLLLLLPGFASLMTARYIESLPYNPTSSGVALQIGSYWFSILSVFAWCIYVLSIISLISITIYALKTAVGSKESEAKKR